MAETHKEKYVTQTGMVVDTSHAYFNLPGADRVFNTIKVNSYHDLQETVTRGIVTPETKLMLFSIEETTIAIPLQQIAFHHVAQGKINDMEWAVAFCACCNMGAAFTPLIDGVVHHFSGTGVYHGMAIIRDKETGSYWEHATGECIHGILRGRHLEIIPAQYMLANQLLESSRSALVTIAQQSWWQRILDSLLMKDMLSPQGHLPAPFRLSMGKIDKRLPEMQLGLGLWHHGKARFYSMETLKAHWNVLIDTLSRESFVIFIDPVAQVPIAHRSKASSFTWDGDTLVLDTGERLRNGFVQKNNSEQYHIDASSQQFVRWYAFAFKFPNCEIYGY